MINAEHLLTLHLKLLRITVMRDSLLIFGPLEVLNILIAVVLYAMLSGMVPFKANNMEELHKIITKGVYAPIKDISDDACNLLGGLLEIDQKKRLTTSQILAHPFLINSKTKSIIF
jgi:serine/threonine protein kinase